MAKLLRIIRTVTTVTDVDLTSYFDVPNLMNKVEGAKGKRYWTAEEAIAYERSRGQSDQQDAFELAMQNDEYAGVRLSFDVITVPDADERTADEKIADDLGATYLTPSRDGSLVPHPEDELPRHKTPMAGLPTDH